MGLAFCGPFGRTRAAEHQGGIDRQHEGVACGCTVAVLDRDDDIKRAALRGRAADGDGADSAPLGPLTVPEVLEKLGVKPAGKPLICKS